MPRPPTRRQFLRLAGLGALTALARPGAPQAEAPLGPPVYFVAPAGYRELPADCFAANTISPREIILHWDGNRNDRPLWKAVITYETLALLKQSSHFAIDDKRTLQLLPMYRTRVQESYGAKGYNDRSINVELAGREFDQPEFAPAPSQVARTLQLVSLLMDFYHLPPASVVGHYERDDRGLKRDPGPQFMAAFRDQLRAYRANRPPLKTALQPAP